MRRTVGPLRGLDDPAALILTVDPLRSGADRSSRARRLTDRENLSPERANSPDWRKVSRLRMDQLTLFVGDSSMSNLFQTIANATSGPARTRKERKTTRRVNLNLEVLGERTLLSVSPIHAVAVQTPIAHLHLIPHPHVVDVPSLKGYTFYLNSTNGKPAHTLAITSETYNRFGSASFTGTWSGDGPNSHAVSGTLVFAAKSKTVVNVNFSWTNGSGGQNSFSGSLTPVHNRIVVFSAGYFLSGTVTSSTGGGPGMVSGYGYPPRPVLTNHF
jgi:hypothetical protein